MRYALAGLMGVAMAMGVVVWLLQGRLATAKAETATVRAELGMLLAAARETIAEQKSALTQWEAASKAQAEQVAKARSDAARLAAAALVMQARIRNLEAQDHDKPECQTLLATDIAAICPGHAAALRLRAGRVP